MKDDNLKVSIVVPVFNDEIFMSACLKAIKRQSVKAHEIIVVDNNCSDGSMNIAKRFKGIKIVNEYRQGLCFARAKGFDEANGDFVVRIDADAKLPKDYIKTLKTIVNDNRNVSGFTGYGVSSFEAIPRTSRFWGWLYFAYTKAYLGHQVLWGSNMVIRKSSWNKLKKYLINDDKLVHEDQDISLALASIGGAALYVKELNIFMTMEEVQHYSKYHKYVKMLRNIKGLDKSNPRYLLKTRLPAIALYKRIILWLLSAWAIYAFYFITIVYSAYWNIKRFMLAH